MKALVIGGTGPTGPHLINGLLERGYQVSMLNRGSRDSSRIPAEVERIVADPHFAETLAEQLHGRTFDVALATYGRLRIVADLLADKVGQLITVGGPPSYRGMHDPDALTPTGLPIATPEDAAKVDSIEEHRFGYLVHQAEQTVMDIHASGRTSATHFRYPVVYGPGQVRPTMVWLVMRRCLDKRDFMVLPEAGLSLVSRGYERNMAHCLLLAVDKPEAAAGQIYNAADVQQLSLAQWVQLIAQRLQHKLEVVTVPDVFASSARDLIPFRASAHHQLLDVHKARAELGYTDVVAVPDAVNATVDWFCAHHPEQDEAFYAELKIHYKTEDALNKIVASASDAMAKLEHYNQPYHHSYAHPQQPGLGRDHRNR